MRKTWKTKNLNERSSGRAFLALSLAASLAAFGCTTNRTPGNGEPVGVVRPGVGPAPPSSGVTGSSTGATTPNQPMFSSSAYMEALPSVNARSSRLPLSPDQAAAVLAGNQQLSRGVRVLGPSSPGTSAGNAGGPTIAQTQLPNPAMQINPILTVNSSVNSAAHLPAIAADGGSGGAVGGAGGFTAGVTNGSVISGSPTVTGATAGTTVGASGGAVPTPTTATPAFTAGNFAAGPGSTGGVGTAGVTSTTTNNNNGTLTPTVSSSVNPAPTVTTARTAATTNGGTALVNGTGTAATTTGAAAANGTAAAANDTVAANGTATANRTGTATRTGTLRTARNTTVTAASGSASGTATPIRVSTDANGKVTITNGSGARQQK